MVAATAAGAARRRGVPAVARPKAPIDRSQRSSSRDCGQLLGRALPDRARDQHDSRIRAPAPGLLSVLRPAPGARAGVESALCPLPSADHREAHRRASRLPDRGRGAGVRGRAATHRGLRAADAGAGTMAPACGCGWRARRKARRGSLPPGSRREWSSSARTLYLTTVDRAFRAAKRDHDWEAASRIRREKATVLYRVAGSPLPPPADLVAMFREGVAAELRGIAEISRDAELVSASCCDVCRADDRLISRISHELREPRLPHDGCPRGLCRCRWDLAERDRTTMRRYLRRRPRAESRAPERTGADGLTQRGQWIRRRNAGRLGAHVRKRDQAGASYPERITGCPRWWCGEVGDVNRPALGAGAKNRGGPDRVPSASSGCGTLRRERRDSGGGRAAPGRGR